jgi:uncharacterized protein
VELGVPTGRIVALILALLVAVFGSAANAQAFPPRPAGPVYDGANMLSPATEARLDQQLRAYNAQTGRAIVVATVPDLGGQAVDQYATALFSTWGIGGAARDQGLLLLVSRDDRRMRIEVGYGLHPYFGGIMAGRVIRDVITPRFKANDFDEGITAGVDAIIQHLSRTPAEAAAIEEAAETASAQRSREGGFPIGALFWLAILFFFILPAFRGGRRRRYRRSGLGGAVGNIVLWEAGSAIARGMLNSGGGGGGIGGGGGGFGGFGGGMSGGGGASGGW